MRTMLIYVHDPMCSWCWGFEPTRAKLFTALDGRIPIQRLVGGLAPDSDAPMADDMQLGLQQTWQNIQQTIPGTEFNFDFWSDCAPRRSTYPSNRAVIAARRQDERFDQLMSQRIQRAYYLEARNPSDDETLIELAAEIGLDSERFRQELGDATTRQLFATELQYSRELGINSFPSLAVVSASNLHHIGLNYTDAGAMQGQIEALIE
jgi:putative protein-disulfide isomerase